MNRSTFYGVLSLITFFSFSCNKNQPDGKWRDSIKLSKKAIEFNSSAGTATVTTGSAGWWLNNIGFNGKKVDISNVKRTAHKFVIQRPAFTVERKDGTTLFISMSENNSGSDRILSIGLQAGDYFDGIKITQAK